MSKDDSERAWALGQEHARRTPFSVYEKDQDSERLYQAAIGMGCPLMFFDLFKYGAQEVWRRPKWIKTVDDQPKCRRCGEWPCHESCPGFIGDEP